jgi:Ca-activated chloride channel family protein
MKHRKLLIGTSIGCAVLLAGGALYLGCAASLSRSRETSGVDAARPAEYYADQAAEEESGAAYFHYGVSSASKALSNAATEVHGLVGEDALTTVDASPNFEYFALDDAAFKVDAPTISVSGGGGAGGSGAGGKAVHEKLRGRRASRGRSPQGTYADMVGRYADHLRARRGFDDTPERVEAILARLSRADEIWVIEKTAFPAAVKSDRGPGCGALLARAPAETETVPVPLKHTDVQARVSGYIATVEVTQEFHNPFNEKIEAVYVFPLPQNSAVNEFLMTIGERTIRGIIREREEAEQIYAAARRQGHAASLLTQERPNIFTQKVANIEPGKEIDINIKYFNTLAYVDGSYEFVFPMVVGPRFNPPGTTDGVGAVARGKHGSSGQSTEVQYLAPHERSGHDISVAVEIDAGVEIEDITSPTHAIEVEQDASEFAAVRLSELDAIPNKDFVLHYKVAGDAVKSTLLTHRDERGGFFTLMLYPPAELADLQRQPTEMIFVLDCSGSMSGAPIAKAKAAAERALKRLRPDDTFQIIRFSNNASQLGPAPLLATSKNVRRGLDYIRSLNGNGGTMMIEGIKAALDFPHDRERLRLVSFMTDGYIGNEAQIFGEIYQRLGDARIFSFGVGSSVNRYLLEGMARLGHGAVAYVGLDDSTGEAVDLFYKRISHPAMTDIEIDWGGMGVSDVYPREIPDLFVGRPVVLTGRFEGDGLADIRVTGRCGAEEREIALTADLEDASATHAGIPSVWARTQIRHLADRMTRSDDFELPQQIREVAFEYNLMSKYTSFVAVDSKTVTAGDHGISLAVPVPTPAGVRYDTTVSE